MQESFSSNPDRTVYDLNKSDENYAIICANLAEVFVDTARYCVLFVVFSTGYG